MAKKMNKRLFKEAEKHIPGGVNSPVRAFKAVGGTPLFIKRGKGSKIYDVKGREYIDYVMSWGALVLGHGHPEVIRKVRAALVNGTSFGAPTQIETELAKEICKAYPSIEKVRLVNSGTEACMSAVRLARGYTGRAKIIKFSGCYHGHADYLLVQAGSGMTTFRSTSLGVPKDFIKYTFVLPYNNLDAVEKTVKKYHKDIACIIIEPIAGNMGVVLPEGDFLQGLREICDRYKIVLIFDEVITGFRVAYGGAQEIYRVKPDITCLGKIIGGGLPIGAFGGNKEIMDNLSPGGDVYQAGTLSGNPVGVTAGLTTLKILSTRKVYGLLEKKAGLLCKGIEENINKTGVKAVINRAGSMFTIFFTNEKEVCYYKTAARSNTGHYAQFFHEMLKQGIYLPPSQFESCFVSIAHTEADIKKTIKASLMAFEKYKVASSATCRGGRR
ncbi:MAG: glutamate-1-semialdehyde 2,1-aminomutase [bacterium]